MMGAAPPAAGPVAIPDQARPDAAGLRWGSGGFAPRPPRELPPPVVPAGPLRRRHRWPLATIGQAFAYRPLPSVRAWLLGGILRNLRGQAAGIIAAWFDLPLVLVMTAVGGLFGGIAGAVSGTSAGNVVLGRMNDLVHWVLPLPVPIKDLLPTAAAQIGGIIGAILGALHGAWVLGVITAIYPWQALYQSDPIWPVAVVLGQVAAAVFTGCLYTVYSVAFERFRLRISGARRMSRREEEFLIPLVEECAARLGLRGIPWVMMDDSRAINASAGARHIVICQGLLDEFGSDHDALCGVITHELVHWRDGDAISLAWGKGTALPLYLLYLLAVRVLDMARWRPLQFVLRTLLWSVLVSVNYFVIPLQASSWRKSELRADAGALAAGYGPGLRRVLTRLRRSFDNGRDGWDRAICASHPANELRLEALEEAGKSYPLLGDQGVARPMLPGSASVARAASSLEID